MIHTASCTLCLHSYHLTHIEVSKICFESLVIHLMSIIHHFGLYRLIPKLHGSLSMLTKMAGDL